MIEIDAVVYTHDNEPYSPQDMYNILVDAEIEEAYLTDWEIDFVCKYQDWWTEIHDNTCTKLVEIFTERYIEKRVPDGC